jgi:hypothetical protein
MTEYLPVCEVGSIIRGLGGMLEIRSDNGRDHAGMEPAC